MKSLSLAGGLLMATTFLFVGQAQAYDPATRDAGSKIRGDYLPGHHNTRSYVRSAPVMQNNIVTTAPQVVENAPAATPSPNATAQVDNNRNRSTRTFSVEPNTQPSTGGASVRTFRRNRGLNLNANRKVLDDYGR